MLLSEQTRALMPQGKPNFPDVIKYPKIQSLVAEVGFNGVQKMVFMLIRDLCNNVNVVRNMSEDQMIELAGVMVDECGNYRLEDYVMFFASVKRGRYGLIRDRLDMQTILNMLDDYYLDRRQVGQAIQAAEVPKVDEVIASERKRTHEQDNKLYRSMDKLSDAFSALKNKFKM